MAWRVAGAGARDDTVPTLASFARRLNAPARAPALPALLFLTERSRIADPLAVAARLPPGAGVILRDYDAPGRRALAASVADAARARGLCLLVGGDGDLARDLGAAGLHLPERRMAEAPRWRGRHPDWLITVSAHSRQALRAALLLGADAALLGPVFATASHPGAAPLGVPRLRALAHASPLPVIALGGLNADNVARLGGAPIAGIAAIGGLARELLPTGS